MQTTISRKVKPMIQDSSQIDKYRQNIFRRPAAQNNFTGNTTDDINRYISNREDKENRKTGMCILRQKILILMPC